MLNGLTPLADAQLAIALNEPLLLVPRFHYALATGAILLGWFTAAIKRVVAPIDVAASYLMLKAFLLNRVEASLPIGLALVVLMQRPIRSGWP